MIANDVSGDLDYEFAYSVNPSSSPPSINFSTYVAKHVKGESDSLQAAVKRALFSFHNEFLAK